MGEGSTASKSKTVRIAEATERKQRGQELSKLQSKYGDDGYASDSSSDYSSEDDDAEFVTPAVDAAIFKTLAKIRSADPAIYDPARKVFDELEQSTSKQPMAAKAKSSNPVHLKDLERITLLKQGSQPFDTAPTLTPYQEEQALKAETTAAFHLESDGDDDDLLIPRTKTDAEVEMEDEEYKAFLLDSVGGQAALEALLTSQIPSLPSTSLEPIDDLQPIEGEKKKKKKKKAIKSQADDDAFLRDYILNRGWIDKTASHIPTHEEILNEPKEDEPVWEGPTGVNALPAYKPLDRNINDSEDEEFEDKAEEFETKYNFRFEDQAGADIVTHARANETTVRRTDDTRKKAREARTERKAAERAEKEAARSRIKDLKRKEILDKLKQIQTIAGTGRDLVEEGLDLEGDFDEAEHERQMQKMFGEDFYAEEDPDGKPTWAEDIDMGDIGEYNDETPLPEMEEEAYDPSAPIKKEKKDKKKKDKKGKAKAVEEEPVMNPEELENVLEQNPNKSAFADDLDELYQLDHEDMIGDLATRFSYTKVPVPTDGLTPAEILMATDAELNSLVGLKKLAAYRNGATGDGQPKRKRVKELKSALGKRKWGGDLPKKGEEVDLEKYTKKRQKLNAAENGLPAGVGEKPKKRMGKKERQKAKETAVGGDAADSAAV